jgi:hypothetical protein
MNKHKLTEKKEKEKLAKLYNLIILTTNLLSKKSTTTTTK